MPPGDQGPPQRTASEVVSWLGDTLKVKVHAPALEGRANQELCEFLADVLKIPRRSVRLLQGEKSQQKLVQIDGLSCAEVRARLGPPVM